jgi:hypothetical protein
MNKNTSDQYASLSKFRKGPVVVGSDLHFATCRLNWYQEEYVLSHGHGSLWCVLRILARSHPLEMSVCINRTMTFREGLRALYDLR